MPPSFVPVGASDAAALAALVVELYREDPGPVAMSRERAEAQVHGMLAAPAHVEPLFVALDGEVVGYVILARFYSNEFGGLMLYVDELWLRPGRRGAGLGEATLLALVERARDQGYARVALEVNTDNVRARRFYERLGFRVEARSTLAIQLVGV